MESTYRKIRRKTQKDRARRGARICWGLALGALALAGMLVTGCTRAMATDWAQKSALIPSSPLAWVTPVDSGDGVVRLGAR